jgi:hypothetical protein
VDKTGRSTSEGWISREGRPLHVTELESNVTFPPQRFFSLMPKTRNSTRFVFLLRRCSPGCPSTACIYPRSAREVGDIDAGGRKVRTSITFNTTYATFSRVLQVPFQLLSVIVSSQPAPPRWPCPLSTFETIVLTRLLQNFL